MRDFIDKQHNIIGRYYDIMDRYTGRNPNYIIPKLKKLVETDPNFFDPYISLAELYYSINQFDKVNTLINQASERALKRIVDKKGAWPDKLEWVWLENRHIIRAILNQALLYWKNEQTDDALDLYRKLLRSNPIDNVGARNYILAIRKNISFDDFELRFNKNEYYDMDLVNWFDANYKSYPEEFAWWDEEMDKLDYQDDDEEVDLAEIESEKEMQIFTNMDDTPAKDLFTPSEEYSEPKIFQLKITLKHVKPPIWRRILISNQVNFYELHLTIQDFFNWGSYHLRQSPPTKVRGL